MVFVRMFIWQKKRERRLKDLKKSSTEFSLENGVKLEIYKGDLVKATVANFTYYIDHFILYKILVGLY